MNEKKENIKDKVLSEFGNLPYTEFELKLIDLTEKLTREECEKEFIKKFEDFQKDITSNKSKEELMNIIKPFIEKLVQEIRTEAQKEL